MSADRTKRAERVVDLRRRAVEQAQTLAAEAARRVAEAEAAAREAEALWSRESAAPAHGSASSADLAEVNAWLRALRQRADRAATQVGVARAEAQRCHEALVAARGELRRIELWRDGLAAAARATQDRKERTAADEVAARAVRRSL